MSTSSSDQNTDTVASANNESGYTLFNGPSMLEAEFEKELLFEHADVKIEMNSPAPIDNTQLASFMETRSISKRGQELIKVDYKNIKFREGFNGRIEYVETPEHALSILLVGLLTPPTGDLFKNGDFLLTTGHRRMQAIYFIQEKSTEELANIFSINSDVIDKRKEDLTFVTVMQNPKTWTDLERTKAMVIENVRKDKKPVEWAENLLRLKNLYGMSAADIAKECNISPMRVSNALALAGISDAERELIEKGMIKPTAATRLAKLVDDADERIEMINEAVSDHGKFKESDLPESNPAGLMQQEPDEDEGDQWKGDSDEAAERASETYNPLDIDDDPSMKGTSAKAASPSKKDPAIKSINQPDEDDKDDERLRSGKSTAYDIIVGLKELFNKLDKAIPDNERDPKVDTIIYEIDKKLSDAVSVLKK